MVIAGAADNDPSLASGWIHNPGWSFELTICATAPVASPPTSSRVRSLRSVIATRPRSKRTRWAAPLGGTLPTRMNGVVGEAGAWAPIYFTSIGVVLLDNALSTFDSEARTDSGRSAAVAGSRTWMPLAHRLARSEKSRGT